MERMSSRDNQAWIWVLVVFFCECDSDELLNVFEPGRPRAGGGGGNEQGGVGAEQYLGWKS